MKATPHLSFLSILFTLSFLLPSQCQQAALESIDYAFGATAIFDTISLMSTSLLFIGDPRAVIVSLSAKMFQYVKFLGVSYSDEFYRRLSSQRTTSIFLDFGIELSDTVQAKFTTSLPPLSFSRYQLRPNFLINFFPGITAIIIVYGILGIISIIECLTSKYYYRYLPKSSVYQARIAVQNFCLVIFYNAYPDVVLFSLVDFKSTKVHSNFDGFSFCISLIFLVGGGIYIWSHIKVLWHYRSLLKRTGELAEKELIAFHKQHEPRQVLFRGFKTSSVSAIFCLLIFTGRAVLSSIIMACLCDYPIAQVVLLLLLNLSMFVYLIKISPFETSNNKYLQLISEVLYFSINVCTLIMGTMDNNMTSDPDTRVNIGRYLMFANMFFNLLVLIFLAQHAAEVAKNSCRTKPKSLKLPASRIQMVTDRNTSNNNTRNSTRTNTNPHIEIPLHRSSSRPKIPQSSPSNTYTPDKPVIKLEAVRPARPEIFLPIPKPDNDDSINYSCHTNQSLIASPPRNSSPTIIKSSNTLEPQRLQTTDFMFRGSSLNTPANKDRQMLTLLTNSNRSTPTAKNESAGFDQLSVAVPVTYSKALRRGKSHMTDVNPEMCTDNNFQGESLMLKRLKKGRSTDLDSPTLEGNSRASGTPEAMTPNPNYKESTLGFTFQEESAFSFSFQNDSTVSSATMKDETPFKKKRRR